MGQAYLLNLTASKLALCVNEIDIDENRPLPNSAPCAPSTNRTAYARP